jgi:hypothetical protein
MAAHYSKNAGLNKWKYYSRRMNAGPETSTRDQIAPAVGVIFA